MPWSQQAHRMVILWLITNSRSVLAKEIGRSTSIYGLYVITFTTNYSGSYGRQAYKIRADFKILNPLQIKLFGFYFVSISAMLYGIRSAFQLEFLIKYITGLFQ